MDDLFFAMGRYWDAGTGAAIKRLPRDHRKSVCALCTIPTSAVCESKSAEVFGLTCFDGNLAKDGRLQVQVPDFRPAWLNLFAATADPSKGEGALGRSFRFRQVRSR